MLGKKKKQSPGQNPTSSQTPDSASATQSASETDGLTLTKYPRPKILLIDMKDDTETLLKAEGYNAVSGSFGVPYKTSINDGCSRVEFHKLRLRNYEEQEIIVLDLFPSNPTDELPKDIVTPPGKAYLWAKNSEGIIDPRPQVMDIVRSSFDRILKHSGLFIIFADARKFHNWIESSVDRHNRLISSKPVFVDNWCFLSTLNGFNLNIRYDNGEEIHITEGKHPLIRVLSNYIERARFLCTLQPSNEIKNSWVSLATNKYGAPVAGVIAPREEGEGWIFIFPQLKDKSQFIMSLLKDVLPEMSPRLFPHVEGGRWVERSEYELPEVLGLRSKIHQIQEEARKRVVELEKAIEEERTSMAYLHDLIRETGEPLAKAVKKTLEVLGFKSVIDVDKEMEASGDTRPKREDLQIQDYSPLLLVEVKGITNLPRDAEALQVSKYLIPRMRELGRTDIQGLAIINHQRNIPPLDRNNISPFREDILINAKEQGFGLITAWDLHRLTRSYLKYEWRHDLIQDLLYETGRIDPVPAHYKLIGVIERYWEKPGVVGVRIQAELKKGDRIAFELPVEFEEQEIASLEVENQPVAQAEIGMLAGIKTHLTKEQARKGIRVFRLIDLSEKK